MSLSQGVIYAEFDVWCMVIMVMLTLRTIFLSRKLEHQKLYLLLMAFAMALVCSDFCYELCDAGVINCPMSVVYLFNIIYFISCICISCLWFIYSQAVVFPELFKEMWLRIVEVIPALLLCVATFFTGKTRWVFYFDETGYHRGSLNWLYMLIPLIYFISAMVIALIGYLRNRNKQSADRLKTIAAFALFPIGAVAVQAFFVGFPAVCIGASLGMLQVFLNNIAKDREELMIRDVAAVSKNEFFTGMSHEIRTPINAIIGMNTMILRESNDETIRAYARDVDASSKLLLGLVDNIFDISKIESGEFKLVPKKYNLEGIVKDVVAAVAGRVKEKEIKLVVNIDEKLPRYLTGDGIRLRQVILNLLTNGVKSASVGKVTLTMKCLQSDNRSVDLYVSVSDTGSAMNAEEIHKLLNPYETTQEHTSRKTEGPGLGMNISKRILELMESKLEVYSAEGKGTKFHFVVNQKIDDPTPIGIMQIKFPANVIYAQPILEKQNKASGAKGAANAANAGASKSQAANQSGAGAGSSAQKDLQSQNGELGELPPGIRKATEENIAKASKIPMVDESDKKEKYVPKFKAPNARVLSVDDTKINLKVFKALLKPTEMEIDTVESGIEALELVKDNEYDIIFLDIMMPEMDGVETLHAMREEDNKVSDSTPIIALTANALEGSREEYLAEGFNDFLAKPIAVQLLEKLIVSNLSADKVTKNE